MRPNCPHSGGGYGHGGHEYRGHGCAGAEGGSSTRKQIAGWQGYLAYLGTAAAQIGALQRCFLQGFDGEAWKTIARCGSAIGLEGWQKGRFSGFVRLTAILCGEKKRRERGIHVQQTAF